MKKKLNKLEVISIIFLIVIVLALLYTIFDLKNQSCTKKVKICDDGTVVTRTEKNCEFAPCPDIEENRVYCTEEQKQADVCIEIYQPVCGYSDPEKIKCFRAPCALTFSNSCFACLDKDVLYWVDDICE